MNKDLSIFSITLPAFICILSLYSCKNNKEDARAGGKGKQMGLRAEGYVVRPGLFRNDLTASGSLRPNEEVEIHPEVSGRVVSINFKEGSFVGKGQELMRLNDADIRAQMQKLISQRALQQKTLERQAELLKIGGISRQDYETTQTQISSINADLAFQEAALRKTRIYAPFSGKIGLREISNGAVVSPETAVAILQQTNPLKMDFTIPDQYRNAIKPGKSVFFHVDGFEDSKTGKITASDPGANEQTRSIRVRATVPNTRGELTPGAFANVQIPFESDNTALLIPSQAVIPTTRDKKVAVVRKGKAELVIVKLGTRTEDRVEVVTGLAAGDTVIITGIMQVKPGMDVTITKVKS